MRPHDHPFPCEGVGGFLQGVQLVIVRGGGSFALCLVLDYLREAVTDLAAELEGVEFPALFNTLNCFGVNCPASGEGFTA